MNSFFNFYYTEISPALKALDIKIKEHRTYIDIEELSSLLHITPKEINTILNSKHITNLTSDIIPTIMLNGSSYICRLFKKSLSYCNIKTYTAADISYIYGIDREKVEKAFLSLNIREISDSELPSLFRLI